MQRKQENVVFIIIFTLGKKKSNLSRKFIEFEDLKIQGEGSDLLPRGRTLANCRIPSEDQGQGIDYKVKAHSCIGGLHLISIHSKKRWAFEIACIFLSE